MAALMLSRPFRGQNRMSRLFDRMVDQMFREWPFLGGQGRGRYLPGTGRVSGPRQQSGGQNGRRVWTPKTSILACWETS